MNQRKFTPRGGETQESTANFDFRESGGLYFEEIFEALKKLNRESSLPMAPREMIIPFDPWPKDAP